MYKRIQKGFHVWYWLRNHQPIAILSKAFKGFDNYHSIRYVNFSQKTFSHYQTGIDISIEIKVATDKEMKSDTEQNMKLE